MNQGLFGFPTQPGITNQSKVFYFFKSGIFDIPENAYKIIIYAQGGGGGAASGVLDVAGTTRNGAAGTAGGNLTCAAVFTYLFPTRRLFINVGAGGAGGAPRTTSGNTHNAGANGGNTSVTIPYGVTLAIAGGGPGGTSATSGSISFTNYPQGASGGSGGNAPNNSFSGGAVLAASGNLFSVNGGAGAGGVNTSNAHGGGGGSNTNTAANAYWVGTTIYQSLGGAAGGGHGQPGKIRLGVFGATGGGGGGGNNNGSGGNGGDGILGSGGGGGGGGTDLGTGQQSGRGGRGGDGFVVIEVYY